MASPSSPEPSHITGRHSGPSASALRWASWADGTHPWTRNWLND